MNKESCSSKCSGDCGGCGGECSGSCGGSCLSSKEALYQAHQALVSLSGVKTARHQVHFKVKNLRDVFADLWDDFSLLHMKAQRFYGPVEQQKFNQLFPLMSTVKRELVALEQWAAKAEPTLKDTEGVEEFSLVKSMRKKLVEMERSLQEFVDV